MEFRRSSDFRLSTSSLGPSWPEQFERESSVESSSLFEEGGSETGSLSGGIGTRGSKSQPEGRKSKKKKFGLPKMRKSSSAPKRGNNAARMRKWISLAIYLAIIEAITTNC